MKTWLIDTIAIILIVAWSLHAFGAEMEKEPRFGDVQKLELEKKFGAKIIMSCTTGGHSSSEYQMSVGKEVLVLKGDDFFRVLLKRDKKNKYFRISKIHINKGKHEALIDDDSKLVVKHRHLSPFYPLKISLEVNKETGTGLYEHKGSNGVFGVIGDHDTYYANLFLTDCREF